MFYLGVQLIFLKQEEKIHVNLSITRRTTFLVLLSFDCTHTKGLNSLFSLMAMGTQHNLGGHIVSLYLKLH